MDRSKLKQTALLLLRGNWEWAVILSLLTAIIAGLIAGATKGIGSIIAGLITAGYAFTFLDLVAGKKETNYFSAMFSAFTNSRLLPVFLTWLLQTIFVLLWTILLIVPGIIKALAYSQAFFIAKDMVDSGREVQATEAITKSKQLMDGHKWEFFVLQLSFLGWAILCIFTCGIGFLWLRPYMQTTNALYYRQLAKDRFRTSAADATEMTNNLETM